MNTQEILNLTVQSYDFDEPLTIREYLKELLLTLWVEGEGFSGKRPFGNSGWQYDLYKALIIAGAVEGKLDEDGYVIELSTLEADKLICDLIREVFKQ